MDISAWLKQATKQLKDIGIDSNRLDAELILSHTLRKPRTYLHAHLEDIIDPRRKDIADARLELRKERVPLAYIIGHKEFYGRRFKVTPATLIPRPESEDIISLLLEYTADEITPKTLIDVGTGSGCLAITAKLERPHLSVTACDISPAALRVAQENATQLHASVTFIKSDLLSQVVVPAEYICANLPYVDRTWETSPELQSEPDLALYAADEGLRIIRRVLPQAVASLRPNGLLFCEADPVQHAMIINDAQPLGLHHITTRGYCIVLRKS
jgi:release factor glutamine methyltransferase